MAHIKSLLTAVALACAVTASQAGYAQLAAPAGWSSVSSAQGVSTTVFRAAANDAVMRTAANEAMFMTRVVTQVGGTAVEIPAAMRFSANAGRVMASAAFSNPLLFGALAVAGGAAYMYYKNQGFEVKNGVWSEKVLQEDKYECYYSGSIGSEPSCISEGEVKVKLDKAYNFAFGKPYFEFQSIIKSTASPITKEYCITTRYAPGEPQKSQCVNFIQGRIKITPTEEWKPVPQSQFETKMSPLPIPQGAPEGWPMALPPLPVEAPILNPSPSPQLKPQPLRVPIGDPMPVPNTNPQQWRTPVIDIVPSPTPDAPWRVDLQPKDVTKSDSTPLPPKSSVPVPLPTPVTDPNVVPDPNAVPVPVPVPNPNPNDPVVTPSEKTPGLCDLYPDILACSKPELNTPDLEEIQKKDIDVSTITPDSGWGGSAGACPAPRRLPGAKVDFEFTQVCGFMKGIRPVVIAFAWLAAAMILIGVRSGGDA